VVETGRVKVSRITHHHEQNVDELLHHEKVEVERVSLDRPIDAMPSIRQEGDVTIIPVVEEILKVERCLVLKEEIRIRRIKTTERYQEHVTLRKQEATVTRSAVSPSTALEEDSQPTQSNQERQNHEQL
jgi:stress response protein YsnF